ncbi:M48 family metalloprotease [Pleionea litopenaei]|uniref:Putative beta-barrel assembly-enhancing protease n=1 Tax=Pleionea litopenaei TaxID=3070815 RepID=A0AA51RTM2_9GAMM|nr:M48 family metalloprotease [Pleionea sp. HL-JVS1]WMS87438.1 M48 family metalloprotease [Pleionea sp. HL-JVS1]
MSLSLRALRNLAVSAIAASGIVFAANPSLPELGSSTSRILSVTQEQAIGDEYILGIRRYLPLVHDPLAVDYINHLGFKLVEQNPDAQDRRFYFFIIQDPTLNAFALPGGYIGTHSGLISAADSESELAAVLGHEIAHVTQRHLARRMERMQQLSFPALASFIGGILVASQNPEAGIGMMATANAGLQQAIINHTRENEKEADRIGILAMSRAGFDPAAVAGFFEKMQQATRYLRQPPEFLRTHPVNQTRISDARARARSMPEPANVDSLEFQLIKTRLSVNEDKKANSHYKELQALYQDNQLNDELQHYRLAMLSLKVQNNALAIDILKQLYFQRQRNLIYLVSLAEAYLAANQPAKGLPFLESELKTTPTSYPLIMTYAKLLMADEQPQKARVLLLEHAYEDAQEPQMFKLLSEAQSLSGHLNEVHESQGQYLYATGDLQGALAQFEIALGRSTEDPYATTRIRAKIDQINQILRQRRNRH